MEKRRNAGLGSAKGRRLRTWKRGTKTMDQLRGMVETAAASAAGEMNQEGIQGIVMEGNCNRRCWLAHGNICRCSCRGENHSAMRPGSLRLRSTSEGRELQTIMAGLAPEARTE